MFMTLYEDNVVVATGSHGGWHVERMIFYELKPNKQYVINVHYVLPWDGGVCHEVIMELAMQPTSIAKALFDCKGQHENEDIPPVIPTSQDNYYYEWYTEPTKEMWAVLDGSSVVTTSAPLELVEVKVPHIVGRHQRWKFRVELQYNFLDGGDVYAILVSNNASLTTMPTLATCISKGVCGYGFRAMKNVFVLQDILTGGLDGQDGLYTLYIQQRTVGAPQRQICTPYSVNILLFPLPEEETFLSCDIDPMPRTFHQPGMYNSQNGYMSFQRSVLVNLTLREQLTTFTPTMDSALRVYVGDHDYLDIDLALLEDDSPTSIAHSDSPDGPEGIVYALKKGSKYTLVVRIPTLWRGNNDRDNDYRAFCDSFDIRVDIRPRSTDTLSCQQEHTPNFGDYQSQINTSSAFSYTANLYFSNKNSNMAPTVFKVFRFYFPKPLFFNLEVEAHFMTGGLGMRLQGDHQTNVIFDRHTYLRNILSARVVRGYYTLTLSSGYAQRSHVPEWSTNIAPKCFPYSMYLTVSSTAHCSGLARLSHEATYAFDQTMNHFIDTFAIPGGSLHTFAIASPVDSLLHVQVTQSDKFVAMRLAKGKVSNWNTPGALDASDMYTTGTPTMFTQIKA
eukprot:PhF_6_TR7985/c0_g1_i2/m.12232